MITELVYLILSIAVSFWF